MLPHLLHDTTEVHEFLENHHATASLLSVTDSGLGVTLLHHAAEWGNDSVAQYLIDLKIKTDHRNVHGRTPLMSAVMVSGHEAVVRVLLRVDSDIHSADNSGESVLQVILRDRDRAHLLYVLLEEVPLSKIVMINDGKRIDDENSRKTVSKEKMMPMKVLLKHRGAYDSIRNGTLLHKAVHMQMFEAAKVLLDHGADVDALDSWGAIPLFYLYNYKSKHSIQALEVLEILASRSTRLTTSAEEGRMQIYKLLMYGNGDATGILMRSPNIDLNASDERGNTALHYLAVNNKNPDTFARLQGLKFNANVRDKDGYTPLHKAVLVDSLESVKFWLENGADVNHCDNEYNKTPFYCAYESYRIYNQSIVELLFSYGADPQAYPIKDELEWTIFDLVSRGFDNNQLSDLIKAKSLIQYLAIVEALGTEITSRTLLAIKRRRIWINQLDTCRRLIKTVLYGDVTVLAILTANEKRMKTYARNEQLVFQLKKIIGQIFVYKDLLRTRLNRAFELVKLEDRAIQAIGKISCSRNYLYYTVARYVTACLSEGDMKNLCSVFSK